MPVNGMRRNDDAMKTDARTISKGVWKMMICSRRRKMWLPTTAHFSTSLCHSLVPQIFIEPTLYS